MAQPGDLKIVVSAVLEADEQESAQRISQQLPAISAILMAGQGIQIPVTINIPGINQSLHKMLNNLQKTVAPGIQITANIDSTAIGDLQNRLTKMGFDSAAITDITDKLNQQAVTIDRITSKYGEAADGEERLLNLTVTGTDELNRQIEIQERITYTMDQQNKLVMSGVDVQKRVVSNFEEQRRAAEKVTDEIMRRDAYVAQQEAAVQRIRDMSIGRNATIQLDTVQTSAVEQQIDSIRAALDSLKNGNDAYTSAARTNIQTQMQDLKALVAEYQSYQDAQAKNAAYEKQVQSQLDTIRARYTGDSSIKPLLDPNNVNDFNNALSNVLTRMQSVKTAGKEFTAENKADIQALVREADNLGKKYQNIEYVATTLRTKTGTQVNTEQVQALSQYESQLKSMGIYTQEFQNDINSLRTSLSTAFDRQTLTAYLDQFDELKTKVAAFKAEVDTVNGLYAKLGQVQRQIGTQYTKIAGLDPNANAGQLQAEQVQLAALEQQRREIEAQIAAKQQYIQYAQKAAEYDNISTQVSNQMAAADAKVVDQVRQISAQFEQMRLQIQQVQTASGQLSGTYQNLSARVQQLGTDFRTMLNTTDPAQQVSLFTQLRQSISTLSSEVALYKKQESEAFSAEKTATKAASMIDQMRKLDEQYTFIAKDANGLGKTFTELQNRITSITSARDLARWSTDFAAFKQEVMATAAEIRNLTSIYKQMFANDSRITSINVETGTKLDPVRDEERIRALQAEKAELVAQNQVLEQQAQQYGTLINLTDLAAQEITNMSANQTRMSEALAGVTDKARGLKEQIALIPLEVSNLDAKLKQLSIRPQSLTDGFKRVQDAAHAAQQAADGQAQIDAMARYRDAVKSCTDEWRRLMEAQKLGGQSEKLANDIQKARANLQVLAKEWSQFKLDPTLNAEFRQLSVNLQNISTSADMRRWNSQLATFKANVRAAGADVKSFGDILKGNISRILQFATATTSIFTAIRLVRSAVRTIVDLDTALIDLKKTTDETEASYEAFYQRANETAKALGTTTKSIIEQTAAWSRLGFCVKTPAAVIQW